MRSGAVFGRSHDFKAFWGVLEEVLARHHNARPVHSLDEMLLLHDRFPDEIRLYTASVEGRVEAGVVVYRCGTVAHAQYTAAGPTARRMRLLPALYAYIMDNDCDGMEWFDIGTSCEQGGHYLNEGLDAQKAGLGGRCTVYTSYRMQL